MLNSEQINWSKWGGGLLAFIFPINHRSPHILYWGKSSHFLAFELPNSEGCRCLRGHSCLSLSECMSLPGGSLLLFLATMWCRC